MLRLVTFTAPKFGTRNRIGLMLQDLSILDLTVASQTSPVFSSTQYVASPPDELYADMLNFLQCAASYWPPHHLHASLIKSRDQ